MTIETATRRRAVVTFRIVNANESRAHHRCQRERDQQADHDRDGSSDTKLIEEPSRDRRHERNRQEDDYERQSGSQNGQTDVLRRFAPLLSLQFSFLQ